MELPKTLPPETAPTVRAAIKTVREASPDATEIPYKMGQPRSKSMMWKLVRYASGGQNVVGIGTFAEHSAMFFYRGRELDDGKAPLKGTGRDTRFVTLRTPADASSAQVKRLLRAAFRLASS
jgi:hypothetical protein